MIWGILCTIRRHLLLVLSLTIFVLASGSVYAELPKGPGFLSGMRASQSQSAEEAEKLRLSEDWNLICWHPPVLLLHDLESLPQDPELQQWRTSVETLVQSLSRTFPGSETIEDQPRHIGNGKIIHAISRRTENQIPLSRWNFSDPTHSESRHAILLELTHKVQQARAIQQHLTDRNTLTLLVRANYTLQRRLILWNYCDALLQLPAPDHTLQVSEAEWQQTVSEAERLVEAHPYHATWRSYLRIDTLKRFATLTPQARREIAWQLMDRLHPANLDVSQKQFLAQEAFGKLELLLQRFGGVRTADDCLMFAVENYETSEDVAIGNRIVMEPRRLAMEQNRELPATLKALEQVYRNANLRLYVSRTFLNSSLPQPGEEERTIQESVLNRPVYGKGVSQTVVSVQMVPDENQFRVGFLVEGTLTSSTYSPNVVTVYNRSDARYVAFKELQFSASGLQVKPATADVQNQIQIRDLQTPLDPIPVIGFVANGMARNQAESKQESVRRLTEERIRSEVCTRLDTQVDEKLETANTFLQEKVLTPLARLELDLEQVDAQTTEEAAIIRLRLAGGTHPGAFTPRPVPPEESQINLQVHESTVNNFLQQFQLEGQTFTIDSLFAHIRTRLPNLPLDQMAAEQEEELSVTFADSNALTIHFDDSRFLIRVAIKELRVGKRHWKNFEVEAPYLLTAGNREIFIQRDGPVRLIGRIPVGQQVAVRGIFSKIFKKTEGKNILPEKFVASPRFTELVLDQLILQDGWFGISFGPQKTGFAVR